MLAIERLKTASAAIVFGGALLSATGCSSNPSVAVPVEPVVSPIRHVVILVQENRTFNTLFMGFPGARTATAGPCKPNARLAPQCRAGTMVPLHSVTLESNGKPGNGTDLGHGHVYWERAHDGGAMDGFDLNRFGTTGNGPPAGLYPYAYVERSETKTYWSIAREYALADHMFHAATTDSFIAHQQIIAGTNQLGDGAWVTNVPTNMPWGCDAPAGTKTTLLLQDGGFEAHQGPFPCFTWKTMADVLDAAGVSWKYYVACCPLKPSDPSAQIWNAFDAIEAVACVRRDAGSCVRGPDWSGHVASPNTKIFDDLSNGRLPSVSWVIPAFANSDHPKAGCNGGPSWVAGVVDAIGKSSAWNGTAIVVVWDDWGGWYDPVRPPKYDPNALGFRVPMLVVSPYARPGFVSHVQYDFGSILKFVEQNFGTGSLGTSDVTANSIAGIFDFKRKAKPFHAFPIPSVPSCAGTPIDARKTFVED